MPKINGNEIKPGNVIEHNGGLWVAVKCNAVKPGKGGAFVRMKMKSLTTGRVLEDTLNASEKVEQTEVLYRKMAYLYNDGMDYVLMDNETYEQMNAGDFFITNFAFSFAIPISATAPELNLI